MPSDLSTHNAVIYPLIYLPGNDQPRGCLLLASLARVLHTMPLSINNVIDLVIELILIHNVWRCTYAP